MKDFEKIVVALIVLTIIAVVVGGGKAAQFISTAGGFLVNMTQKVVGSNNAT